MSKSRPVLIVFSILAGLQVFTAAATVADVLGPTAMGLIVAAIGAVQVGLSFYVQNLTVPVQDVAAYQSSSGQVVAGPAAGATNGTPVIVEPGTHVDGAALGIEP